MKVHKTFIAMLHTGCSSSATQHGEQAQYSKLDWTHTTSTNAETITKTRGLLPGRNLMGNLIYLNTLL